MNILKKTAIIGLTILLSFASLTGCGVMDKSAAREAAVNFMEAVKTGDTDGVNTYSSGEVASGSFVRLFDADYLKEQLTSGLGDSALNDETLEKLDEFYSLYSTMMEDYKITDVSMNSDGTATAYITMKNSFPFDVITSEKAQEKFAAATESYNNSSADELLTISQEEGAEAATDKARNDLTMLAIDTYEELIRDSEPVTYMLALTLSKNEETSLWYVTAVQSYDSSVAGTGAPATDTDTSATDASTSETQVPSEDSSAADTSGN
ncbi:MAG: hypothetical protein IJ695_09970 [Butyrivibrio sp.]|nr:hypothetical protein [Butyrivibrio sp.]